MEGCCEENPKSDSTEGLSAIFPCCNKPVWPEVMEMANDGFDEFDDNDDEDYDDGDED